MFKLKQYKVYYIQHGSNSPETKKWVWEVTGAYIKGLKRGQTDFRTKCNLIVTCIRGKPDYWFEHTMELVKDTNFHGGWVIGIDIAGVPDTASGLEIAYT